MTSSTLLMALVAGFILLAILNIRRMSFFLVALMLLVTPIANVSFMPREVLGIPGLNIGNIVWLAAIGAIALKMQSRKGTLMLSTYFSLPLVIFMALYLIAVVRTLYDLGSIQSPIYHITTLSLILENLIKPFQLLLAGWVVMAFCVIEGRTISVQRVLYFVPLLIIPLQIYFFFLGGGSGEEYKEGRGIISSSIGYHANQLGAIGSFLLAFVLLAKEYKKTWVLIRYASIGASLLIIALSFSRMAYLTTIALIAFAFFKLKHKERIALVALTSVVVLALSAQLASRIYFGIDKSKKKTDINQVSAGRIDGLWIPLLPHLFDNAVFGSGVYSILKSPEARKGIPTHPHNAYLQVALDMGFLGVVVLLWLLARFLTLGRRTETGFTYIVICWMLMSLTGFSFYPMHANFIIWVSYGFVLATRRTQMRQPTKRKSTMSDAQLRPLQDQA